MSPNQGSNSFVSDSDPDREVLLVASPEGTPLSGRLTGLASSVDLGARVPGRTRSIVEVGFDSRPKPTLLKSRAASEMAASIATIGQDLRAVARGQDCIITVADGEGLRERLTEVLELTRESSPVVLLAAPPAYLEVRELLEPEEASIVILGSCEEDPVAQLAAEESQEAGFPTETPERPARRGRQIARLLGGQSGQATPLVLGSALVTILVAVALTSLAGAGTGKGRAQRTSDLGALSAARSMRDDLPRLLAPATLPNGLPNPAHMPKPVYLARARTAALTVVGANDGSPLAASIRFPDAASFAPLTSRVRVPVRGPGGPVGWAWAEARVGLAGGSGDLAFATGGGYSGPLAVRQGHGMRPDVAVAFDRMAIAALQDGVGLVINSGFRSDAEQARLFAANPDPRWVAPPGRSLHRCGTELDIGPPSAYGWLASNASRFGFLKRYSWEPWHFGFVAGPEPCSAAADGLTTREGGRGAAILLPEFVPGRFRRAILAASLATGVPATLLAAQLKAESNFDPNAVSSAGALGIAQFMPSTAASRGLSDPFDPIASIQAQAKLMAELIDQFGSTRLALAAYNAGPGAVSSCDCVPSFPETVAYVAKVLALAGGATGSVGVPMEVELIR